METYFLLKLLHIIGATVLIGTGFGIAFFMLIANRTKNVAVIAGVSNIVVLADYVLTLPAVIIQPITGVILMIQRGWSITDGWLLLSIALYCLIGCLWLPVVFIQKKMANMAAKAVERDESLSTSYKKLYRAWLYCGYPAFMSIILLLWLMIAKPAL